VLGSPVLAVLCWQSCTGSSVLTALFCLSKLRSAKKEREKSRGAKTQAIFLASFTFAHHANGSFSFVRLLTKKQTEVIRFLTD
jgi:hypothetical protein